MDGYLRCFTAMPENLCKIFTLSIIKSMLKYLELLWMCECVESCRGCKVLHQPVSVSYHIVPRVNINIHYILMHTHIYIYIPVFNVEHNFTGLSIVFN